MKKSNLLGKDLIKIFIIVFITILCFSITHSIGLAADGLFSDAGGFADSDIQKRMEKPDPTVVRSRWVKVDFDQLTGEGLPEGAETIFLNLFDDLSLIAVKDRLEKRSNVRYTWFGKIVGVELGQAIFVVEDGVMVGNITVNGHLYQVRSVGEGLHMVREIDQSRFPDEAPPIPILTPPDILEPSSLYPLLDDGSTIDVLIVYTSDAASESSNINSEIQLAIDETNQSYINSGINQRVRLAHSAQVDYTETGNGSTDLSRLQNPSDGYMDNVHTLRDQYCADIVSLWVKNFDACGIGYLMTTVSTSFASNAFSVVKRSCATGYYSFGHEMGHNMGAHHDRYATSDNGAYTYSHGYVYTANKWRTIMAYNDACAAQGFNCTRIEYWSNPDVNYGGFPTGVSSSSSNSADNRLTLNNTGNTVANFRQSCGSPCATPGMPSTPSPSNGATGVSINPTLNWSACANTDSYDVYFGTSFPPPYVGNTTSTSYSQSGLNYDTLYYWEIIAKNNCGNSTSGSAWSFTTSSIPSCPSLYFWDGDEYIYRGSIFPGAFFPENEYRDHIPLSQLIPKAGEYYLQIREAEPERSFIDMVYLVVIDRTSNGNADVLPNRKPMPESQGCEYLSKNSGENDVGSGESIIRRMVLYPSSATHSALGNVKRQLLYPDHKYVRMDTGDVITLTFPHPPEVGTTRDFIFFAEGFYLPPEK